MRTADLILKTYPADYDWIPFLFRSIAKYVTGYRNVVLVLEEQYPTPDGLPANAVVVRSRRYVGTETSSDVGAVIERLRAWAYTDAERLIFVDSDCVFTRPVDVQTEPLLNIEKPVVHWRKWEEVGEAICWRAPAAQALGYEPAVETMAGYPFCFSHDVMRAFWDYVGGEAGLLALKGFTDWNALGNFALDKCPDQVTKVYAYEALAKPCVRQFWSHGRITAEVREELGRMGLL